MPRLKRLLLNASFEIAQRQRRCSRDGGHVIRNGQKCLVIKESMSKRNYCLECAAVIIGKAERDVMDLKAEIAATQSAGGVRR